MPTRLVLAALIATVTTSLPSAQTRPGPDALARSLQQEYNRVRDLRASFVQTARGGVLSVRSRGEGTVVVKKPGRMRWDYSKPEKQSIISDGTRLIRYYPDTKEVDIVDIPPGDQAPTAMLFLAGKGDVLRDFRVSNVDSPITGTLALRLDPRRPDPDYEHLIVAFHPTTLQIRGLLTHDRQGGDTTTELSGIQENTGVNDKTFAFTPPRGADVRHAGNPR